MKSPSPSLSAERSVLSMLFDGLQIYFRSQEVHDRLLHELQELVVVVSKDTGAIEKYCCNYCDIHVKIYESQLPGIRLNGSIQKFEKGNNVVRYSLNDLEKAVKHYCDKFGVNPNKRTIQRIEFGVNIVAKYPEAMIRAAMMYHGRTAKRDPNGGYYSKRWEFEQYVVKLYKKGPHLVRFEIQIKEMAKIRKLDLYSMANLYDRGHFAHTLYYLYNSVDQFLFVPSDKEHRLPNKYEGKWNSYKSESFWEECSNKDEKYRHSHEVKELIKDHNLIDWASYLKRKILLEGCAMMKISLPALSAMFSVLGLQAQTVAGPKRDRDRRTEKKEVTILVHTHQVVRNAGCGVDVNIQVISYSPLLPRGPPSVFLLLMYE